jgi:hypothetical protein
MCAPIGLSTNARLQLHFEDTPGALQRNRCNHDEHAYCCAGKWNKHVDGWDCLEDQEFLSLEGAAFVARQMLRVHACMLFCR